MNGPLATFLHHSWPGVVGEGEPHTDYRDGNVRVKALIGTADVTPCQRRQMTAIRADASEASGVSNLPETAKTIGMIVDILTNAIFISAAQKLGKYHLV